VSLARSLSRALWKARGIAKPEPILRPRLYNIAHSSRFYRA
jgi:hypothetical protein